MSPSNRDEEVRKFDEAIATLVVIVFIVIFLAFVLPMLGDLLWQSSGFSLWSLWS